MKPLTRTIPFAVLLTFAVAAEAQPTKTLYRCQQMASTHTQRYIETYVKSVGRCMNRVIDTVVRTQTSGPLTDVVGPCARDFRTLVNAAKPQRTLAGRLANRLANSCDADANPRRVKHSPADVLGGGPLAQPILAHNLDAWCTGFGGAGGIDSIDDWIACLTNAATCAAQQQLMVAYPRILEWLGNLRQTLLLHPSCSGSTCASCSDPAIADACVAAETLAADLDGATSDGTPGLGCGHQAVLVPPSPGLPATGQTTSYGAGDDGALQAGQPRSFTDNGDGTITDNATGLMWEKKGNSTGATFCLSETPVQCRDPHNVGNNYTWCNASGGTCIDPANLMDGTVSTIFLEQMNNRCSTDPTVSCNGNSDCSGVGGPCGFAGHRDWRLPNLFEMRTLIDFERLTPMTFPEFDHDCSPGCSITGIDSCSCTQTSYRTSTSWNGGTHLAFLVDFSEGSSNYANKANFYPARGVRGGQ